MVCHGILWASMGLYSNLLVMFYFCSKCQVSIYSSFLGLIEKIDARWPVSRVLSPGKPRGTAIHLECPLPSTSCDRPGQQSGNRPVPPKRHDCPYLVLLRVGFTEPRLLPAARCALTAPFHPYQSVPRHQVAVYFLWHFPWGRPRRALPGTLFPWSPDFPLPAETGSDRPAI